MKIVLIGNRNYEVPPVLGYGGMQRRLNELANGLASCGTTVKILAPKNNSVQYHHNVYFPIEHLTSIRSIENTQNLSVPQREKLVTEHILGIGAFLKRDSEYDLVAYSFDDPRIVNLLEDVPRQTPVVAMLGNVNLRGQKLYSRNFYVTALSQSHAMQYPETNARVIRPSVTCRLPGHEGKSLLETCYSPQHAILKRLRRDDREYLVHVAAISDFKGQATSIHLARECGMPLVLVGPVLHRSVSRRFLDYYYAKVYPHVDERTVFWAGDVREHIKNEFLACAHCALWPSGFENTCWLEPFGRTVVEAIQIGTPVVAFAEGGHSEIIESGRTGFLFSSLEQGVQAIRNCSQLDRPVIPSSGIMPSFGHFAREYMALFEEIAG